MNFSEDTLARNLDALRSRNPQLAERLVLPVETDHVVLEGAEGVLYRPHLSAQPLELGPVIVREALAELPLDSGQTGLVFGVGLGELVEAALQRGASSLWAWDRDPWMWRLALAAHDWSEDIRSGALIPLLGVDLLELSGAEIVCEHPLLGAAYARERELVRGAPIVGEARRAVLCAGGLFVDQVGAALKRRGYALYTLDVERLAVEELDLALQRFDPELVVSINYRDGLAEFCRDRGRRLICWEVDPSTSFLPPVEGVDAAWIFTYRRAHVAAFQRAGFAHVEYLPLAADPDARRPLELSAQERERYRAPVSFVGSSMTENVAPFAQRFVAQLADWSSRIEASGAMDLLKGVLERQRTDPWTPRVAELLEEAVPGFRTAMQAAGGEDPAVLVGELAASERRLMAAISLAPHGLEVWGDSGWKRLEAAGVRYRGLAGHTHELNRIYAGSTVNLDLGRAFQADIVTMRVFDVLACGGFVLTERNDALLELFDVDADLATYSGGGELASQVARFCARPDEAQRRAEQGRETVLARHTVDVRVQTMLERAGAPAECL